MSLPQPTKMAILEKNSKNQPKLKWLRVTSRDDWPQKTLAGVPLN